MNSVPNGIRIIVLSATVLRNGNDFETQEMHWVELCYSIFIPEKINDRSEKQVSIGKKCIIQKQGNVQEVATNIHKYLKYWDWVVELKCFQTCSGDKWSGERDWWSAADRESCDSSLKNVGKIVYGIIFVWSLLTATASAAVDRLWLSRAIFCRGFWNQQARWPWMSDA